MTHKGALRVALAQYRKYFTPSRLLVFADLHVSSHQPSTAKFLNKIFRQLSTRKIRYLKKYKCLSSFSSLNFFLSQHTLHFVHPSRPVAVSRRTPSVAPTVHVPIHPSVFHQSISILSTPGASTSTVPLMHI